MKKRRLVLLTSLALVALLITVGMVFASLKGFRVTIGGGKDNIAGGDFATVGVGRASDPANAAFATVGGGITNFAGGDFATIGGGVGNTASRRAATVGGGSLNETHGIHATIAGGWLNNVSGDNAAVGGGENNIASTHHSAIGGGEANTTEGGWSTVAGGLDNIASGEWATVGGGQGNVASGTIRPTVSGGLSNTASGDAAAVAGGANNTASGDSSTIGGGHDNAASLHGATVSGGSRHENHGIDATIGGGLRNTITADFATVGGGRSNEAAAEVATIAGGGEVTIDFGDGSLTFAGNRVFGIGGTVGGGSGNVAGTDHGDPSNARHATVGGGDQNTASGPGSAVGGGLVNTASGPAATIVGGLRNVAAGSHATVAGGRLNDAGGDFSFAAGFGAKIDPVHDGAFLFADDAGGGLTIDFNSAAANEFAVRATGGARFVSAIDGSGIPTAGVELAPGGGSWSSLSDLNAKVNFSSVHGLDVLERLSEIPIETWSYKAQDPSIRHIGPMAQDFYAAFAVGEGDTHITTVDADGVAFAAIQGLHQLVQKRDAQITALEDRLSALEGVSRLNEVSAQLRSSRVPIILLLGALILAAPALVWRRRDSDSPR